jgi:ribokinase
MVTNKLSSPIYFIGHISIDEIENIYGVNIQPGGAALHAAIAAKTLSEDVKLISVVGKDYPFMEILNLFPDYIKASNKSSTKFFIHYNKSWEAHYHMTYYGAGSRISSSNLPLKELKKKSLVHISPLAPKKVLKLVDKIKTVSPQTSISVNTWIGYIKGVRNREILKELASKVDFFIVNDSEVKTLTKSKSLTIALKLLKAKILVVTLGEFGAIINSGDEVQMIPALNFPVEKIVDTTGAGDAWCGAFLAAYQLTKNFVKSVTAASVISSIKCTDWGFTKLLNLKFKNIQNIAEYVIGLKEGSLQKRILDYI